MSKPSPGYSIFKGEKLVLTAGKRRLNLGTKFILLTSSLVLITAFVSGLYVIKNQERDNYEHLLDHGRSLAVMIAENSVDGITREDTGSLRRIITMVSTDPAIAYIFILNADERVLLYKTAEDFPIHIPAMPHSRDGEDGRRILHKSFYNREDGKHYFNIMAPVATDDSKKSTVVSSERKARSKVIGYVHIGISQEGVRKRVREFIFSILLFTSLIITTGIVLTVFITRRMIAPINDLNEATREIAEGKLDRLITISTNDEVSDLARAFNHMLARLQISHKEVERHTAELMIALDQMSQEISERVRTEKALQESEAKYRVIFEESKDVIFICSPDGKFFDINRAGADLFGYASTGDLRAADPPRDLYDDPEEYAILRTMLERQGFVKDHEVRMKRSDGEKITVLITAAAVPDEQGSIGTYRGVIHDVTEKRRLEQQLVQSQKMEAIGQLAGGIAHDFNNILTAIMGYANLLIMDASEESALKDHAERILASSERAANLTRSLLAFSRKQVISPKPVSVNHIVTTIEELLVRLIGEDIELRTRIDAPDLTVLADSGQIEQVLINLCTNARDAMPRGGVLSIETWSVSVPEQPTDPVIEKPGAYAMVAVSDTGTGIDDKIKEKIFEPFFTTKETGKGTGLGLSIVYGIIKQHNGYVSVQSEPGKGTVFKLYLPLIERASGTVDNAEHPMPRGGTETILVAEDDPEVRKLIRVVLSGSGYEVIEAVDGQDALAVLSREKRKIDLLLLDVIMPKKNGKQVFEIVRNTEPNVKAIFMSGYTADIIDEKGILAQNLNFISKPIAPLELLNIVRQVLDR